MSIDQELQPPTTAAGIDCSGNVEVVRDRQHHRGLMKNIRELLLVASYSPNHVEGATSSVFMCPW